MFTKKPDTRDAFHAPTHIGCETCGKPFTWANSFGVTTPLNGPIKPADFCSMTCLQAWIINQRFGHASPRPFETVETVVD